MAVEVIQEQPTLELLSEGQAVITLYGSIDFGYMLRHRRSFECIQSRLNADTVRHIVIDLRQVKAWTDLQLVSRLRKSRREIVLLVPPGTKLAESLNLRCPIAYSLEQALSL
jgi:hypothetical protein